MATLSAYMSADWETAWCWGGFSSITQIPLQYLKEGWDPNLRALCLIPLQANLTQPYRVNHRSLLLSYSWQNIPDLFVANKYKYSSLYSCKPVVIDTLYFYIHLILWNYSNIVFIFFLFYINASKLYRFMLKLQNESQKQSQQNENVEYLEWLHRIYDVMDYDFMKQKCSS